MNTSDNSYYELLNRLRYFADNHYLINSFTHGQEAELDISKRTLFPTMHVVPPVITRSNGNKLFAFEIIFADLLRMKEDKVENQMEVISDCDRIADDLVNEIKNGNTVFGRMVDLVGDAVTEPFTEDYANVLTGVTLRVTLAAPYTFNACDIPANWNSNDPTEPVFGGRELTMNIYDEGEFVVAAREMNFVGSGVTVTHDANRAIVTITGGGGGGGAVDSVNGQTGVVVLDAGDVGADASGTAASAISTHVGLADPHTQYALESSLGAVATSNDYNDLDNLPSLAGYGDMFKSTYDTDNDGIVDKSETVQIIVRNSTGSTLTKGQVVYLSGATGNRPNAVLAQANSEATSSKTIGIVVADIANNADGNVAVSGTLHDLVTNSFADGDAVWLSATTAGAITATPPSEPNHTVFIGYIARAHPTAGRLVIAIQNGYELDELHGVLITSPSTNDVLYYASDGLWKNKALAKSDVGLGNVDNTSDANKPVSTATQTALNAKQDTLVSGTNIKTVNGTSILGSGDLSVNQTLYDTIRFNAALTGGQTLYSVPGLSGTSSASTFNLAVPQVHSNFRIAMTSAQHASGTLVIDRIFTNYAGTVLATHTLTIPAGSAAGTYTFTGSTYDCSAGNVLMQFKIKNNATSTSGIVLGLENQYL